MRILSNVLTRSDLEETLRQVEGLKIDSIADMTRPKTRARGWTIRTYGNTNRWRNTGTIGADRVHSASYDQHGAWFALLYRIDPEARIVFYKDADHFHKTTKNKYRLPGS